MSLPLPRPSVAEVRADLEGRYDLKLKLAGVEDEGRAAALRPRLDEAERRAEAMATAPFYGSGRLGLRPCRAAFPPEAG